jgi:ABC-type phosphate transport system auxiliary subunit
MRRAEIERIRKEKERLETRKSNLQNDYMDRTILLHDYHDMKGRVDKELVLVKDKLISLQQKIVG